MRAVDIIRKKRDGEALRRSEIEAFVAGVTDGSWPDYQTAALLMAIVLRGMDADETAHLTRAMAHSGTILDLSDIPGPKVDKHSTGGVGDKTSLILAPLAAACGVVVPKMSGRALGHSGGTLDKLESIPGYRTALSLPEFRAALAAIGCALIGQTGEIAPADKKLYALRDVTATVESIPLITGSILSKKIAEGIDALVIDVKCGRGAFMKTRADARRLAEAHVATGAANGVRTTALVTAMDVSLGRAVGNALEVIEALETLKGNGPADLEGLSVALAARMLLLGGVAPTVEEAAARVRAALAAGRGLEKFRQLVERQGGDPRVIDDYGRLPAAPKRALVRAPRAGYVEHLDAELVGRASMRLGAGRDRKEDAIDHGVGVMIQVWRGEQVRAGDAVAEVHYREEARLHPALELLQQALAVGDAPPSPHPQILETVE
ncbi:MAG: thymidine phosphorylase [Gemmataceae bacterium]|nr:thymidine phosphorylase [Gemmataceae bacterium]